MKILRNSFMIVLVTFANFIQSAEKKLAGVKNGIIVKPLNKKLPVGQLCTREKPRSATGRNGAHLGKVLKAKTMKKKPNSDKNNDLLKFFGCK